MNQYIQVFALCLCMFLITLALGSLPNLFTNKRMLTVLSAFGGGILIGVAFLVILPESLKAILNSQNVLGTDQSSGLQDSTVIHIGLAVTSGFVVMILLSEIVSRIQKSAKNRQQNSLN